MTLPPPHPAGIDMVIVPRSSDVGGVEVWRALPMVGRRMVGPFIFWDQIGPGEFLTGRGIDVRPHPHIGLSTVTYLFDGSLDHKDSLGNDVRIVPGDVNLMTAGAGITHSERTGADIRRAPSALFGIQSWLALPRAAEDAAPEFAHIEGGNLPTFAEGGVRGRVVLGDYNGVRSPVPTLWDTLYLDVRMDAGAKMPIPATTEERALYPVKGTIAINGVAYPPAQMLILHPGDAVTVVAQTSVRLMVLGGAVMDGPRHIYWNFVSSSKEKIDQAVQDWQAGLFPPVIGDEDTPI